MTSFLKSFLAVTLILTWFSTSENQAQTPRVIRAYVALCDNVNQGIVPVPVSLGNGQNPKSNLYWGALYGVKTHFKKNSHWTLIETISNPKAKVLERCIFKHRDQDVYLVADAYDGVHIRATTEDFLGAAAGIQDTIIIDNQVITDASLAVYVGHNGLMDFSMTTYPQATDSTCREVIMLGCITRDYFTPAIRQAGAFPLVWTTGLMAPEAYTLEAALHQWVRGADRAAIREAAAAAYHKYQKCGMRGARGLLVGGF